MGQPVTRILTVRRPNTCNYLDWSRLPLPLLATCRLCLDWNRSGPGSRILWCDLSMCPEPCWYTLAILSDENCFLYIEAHFLYEFAVPMTMPLCCLHDCMHFEPDSMLLVGWGDIWPYYKELIKNNGPMGLIVFSSYF